MKVSVHIGHGGACHNSRNFDMSRETKIDVDRVKDDYFWTREYNKVTHKVQDFVKVEQDFYKEQYGAWLEKQNDKHRSRRQYGRVRSPEQVLKADKTKPHEMILQIGKTEDHADPDQLKRAVAALCRETHKQYGSHLHILDFAIHCDESTPHCHLRYVVDYVDKNGDRVPGLTKGLRALGFDLPDPTKKPGRYNNLNMAFTAKIRDSFERIAEQELGREVDRIRGDREDWVPVRNYGALRRKEVALEARESKVAELEQEQTRRAFELDERTRTLTQARREAIKVLDAKKQELLKEQESVDARLKKIELYKTMMQGVQEYGRFVKGLGEIKGRDFLQEECGLSPSEAAKVLKVLESLPEPEKVPSRTKSRGIDPR